MFTYRALAPTWRSRRQPGSREIHTGLRLKEEAPGEVARELKGRGREGGAEGRGCSEPLTCSFAGTWVLGTPSSLRILSGYEAVHDGCSFGPSVGTLEASDSSVVAGTVLWLKKKNTTKI